MLVRDMDTVGGCLPIKVLILEMPVAKRPLTLCTMAVVLSYAISA